MPEAIDEKMLACPDPTSRTAEAEQFCPWSACSTSSMLRAVATTGSGSYSSEGTENIMWRNRDE